MSNPYIGEIRIFAGNFAPNGWLFCQGQTLAIADYDTLFNLIGTTYGGDGQNTFMLPDLSSRVPVHQGGGYVLGAQGGAEQVQLTTNQLPGHSHPAAAQGSYGGQASPANGYWANSTASPYSTSTPTTPMDPAALAAAGGSQPHDNMPPFLALNFIISLFGIYPSQT